MTDDWDAEEPLAEDGNERLEVKRDRLARLLGVLAALRAAGDAGIRPAEIARRTGMSKRTVYRDLRALDSELRFPVWSEDGRWGVEGGAFLPPLRLTLPEAMAVFLSARLVTRYADKYEPQLASAFQKLEEGLPEALARARRADPRRPRAAAASTPTSTATSRTSPARGRIAGSCASATRRPATTATSASPAGPRSARTCSSRRWRRTRCT